MKHFTKENCWRWFLLPFKAYLFAMPTALLICQQLARQRMLSEWPDTVLLLIEDGYIVCFVVLLINAVFAVSTRDKNKIRPALMFAILALISAVVVYPFTVVAPTR
jgi:uncharacterized membrane protein